MANIVDDFIDVGKRVARSIAGSGIGDSLRFDETLVARSAAYNKMSSNARNLVNMSKNLDSVSDEMVNAALKGLKSGGNDAFNAVNQIAQATGGDEAFQKAASEYTEMLDKYDAAKSVSEYAEFLGKEKGKGIGLMSTASGYFLDAQNGNTRIKAAAGAAVGIGVAGRVLSGGSLTRTNTGERDIAGIPFI